jgi:hypothetical protein
MSLFSLFPVACRILFVGTEAYFRNHLIPPAFLFLKFGIGALPTPNTSANSYTGLHVSKIYSLYYFWDNEVMLTMQLSLKKETIALQHVAKSIATCKK